MKNLTITFLCVYLFLGCYKPTKNIKPYSIKLSPFGISDVPRDTLFISLTDKYFPKNEYFTTLILTDNSTLQNAVSFFESYNYPKKGPGKKYYKYGCFEVFEYTRNLQIADHMLDRSESVKYLHALIDDLVSSKSDLKVINNLKESLKEIDY